MLVKLISAVRIKVTDMQITEATLFHTTLKCAARQSCSLGRESRQEHIKSLGI